MCWELLISFFRSLRLNFSNYYGSYYWCLEKLLLGYIKVYSSNYCMEVVLSNKQDNLWTFFNSQKFECRWYCIIQSYNNNISLFRIRISKTSRLWFLYILYCILSMHIEKFFRIIWFIWSTTSPPFLLLFGPTLISSNNITFFGHVIVDVLYLRRLILSCNL